MSSQTYLPNRLPPLTPEVNGHAPARPKNPPVATSVPMLPLTVVTLLRGLRRCWKQAMFLGLILATGFAAFVWFTLPPAKPSAYVKLFLPTSDRGLVYEHPDAALSQQTHKQLLLSRLVLEPTVEKPEVMGLESIREKGDPVGWLSRELNIFFDGPEIVGLRIWGDRPEELKVILDTLTHVYLARIANRAAEDRENRRTHLEKARKSANEELKKIQLKLQEEAKAGGSADRQLLILQHKQITEVMSIAVRRKGEIQNELQRLQTEQLALKTRNPDLLVIPQSQIDDELDLDTTVAFIMQQRQLSQKRLDGILKTFSPEFEEARKLTKEIQQYDEREKAARKEARPRVEKALRERSLNNAKFRLEQLDSEIAAQEKALQGADQEVESLQKEAALLAANLWTVEGSRIELLQAEEKVRAVENSYQKLTVDYNSPPRVSVLEEAIIESVNDSARRMKMAILAGIAGFGMALFFCSFLEYRTNRFSETDELDVLDLPILGTLPNASPRFGFSLFSRRGISAATGDAFEAIETLRVMLLHQTETTGERVLMISSAREDEGESYLAAQLAMSLARTGRRVLLLDGDLRHPQVHGGYQVPLSPGLAECLAEQRNIQEAQRLTAVENLTVLPAGQFDSRSLAGLSQGAFGHLIRELRENFDYILVETSGLLTVADGLQMASEVDGVLIAMRKDHSRLDTVHRVKSRLQTLGVSVLGGVVVE